jgi:transposase-like protein
MWKIKMSKELLLQRQEHVNPLQLEEEKGDKNKTIIHNNIEQEIECPRCHDTMALSSNFDRLSYICQECNLSLLIN